MTGRDLNQWHDEAEASASAEAEYQDEVAASAQADLAGELDRLDKAATPGKWEQDDQSVWTDTAKLVESMRSEDVSLIVWLRNHTDEIKAALADQGWDMAMCDEYIARQHAELIAERDRLRAELDSAPVEWTVLGHPAWPGCAPTFRSRDDADAFVGRYPTLKPEDQSRVRVVRRRRGEWQEEPALAGDDGGDHRG